MYKERAIWLQKVFLLNFYRTQASRREITWKISLDDYLHKTPAGLRQSAFLVGESLHNDAGLTPVLLCAKSPHANIRFCEKAARKVVLMTGMNEDGFIKVFIST